MGTYKTPTNEEDGDGNVFEILSSPFPAPVSEVLQEDVGRPVEENEETLNELGRRAPFLT